MSGQQSAGLQHRVAKKIYAERDGCVGRVATYDSIAVHRVLTKHQRERKTKNKPRAVNEFVQVQYGHCDADNGTR